DAGRGPIAEHAGVAREAIVSEAHPQRTGREVLLEAPTQDEEVDVRRVGHRLNEVQPAQAGRGPFGEPLARVGAGVTVIVEVDRPSAVNDRVAAGNTFLERGDTGDQLEGRSGRVQTGDGAVEERLVGILQEGR